MAFLKFNNRLIDIDLIKFCEITETERTIYPDKTIKSYKIDLNMPRVNMEVSYLFDNYKDAEEIIDIIKHQKGIIKEFNLKEDQIIIS